MSKGRRKKDDEELRARIMPLPERHIDDVARTWLPERQILDADAIVVSGVYGGESVAVRLKPERFRAVARLIMKMSTVAVAVLAGWGWGMLRGGERLESGSSQPCELPEKPDDGSG